MGIKRDLLLLDQSADPYGPDAAAPVPFGPWAARDGRGPSTPRCPTPYAGPHEVRDAALRAWEAAVEAVEALARMLPGLTGVPILPRRFWEVYLLMPVAFLCVQAEDGRRRAEAAPGEAVLGSPDSPPEAPPADFAGLARALLSRSGVRQHLLAAAVRSAHPGAAEEPVRYRRDPFSEGHASSGWRAAASRAKAAAEREVLRAAAPRGASSLLWDAYRLSRGTRFALARAGLPPPAGRDGWADPPKSDPSLRGAAFVDFPEPLRTAFSLAFPRSALEGLPAAIAAGRRIAAIQGAAPRRIVTLGQLWSAPAPSRAAAALLAASGTEIVSVQHGGGYGGSYSSSLNASVEYALADGFVTWGWEAEDEPLGSRTRFIPLPSIILSGLPRPTAGPKSWKVLFLFHTDAPFARWHYMSPFPDRATDYFEREKLLLDAFRSVSPCAVKLSTEDHGWGQEGWLAAEHPAVERERGRTFPSMAAKAELCVIDYSSTGFCEALALGVPFMATWDRGWIQGSPAYEAALDTLRAVGVFHDHPASLAAEYARAAGAIAAWWSEPARREAVAAFARRYARTGSDAAAALARLTTET